VDVADLGLFAGTYLKTSADPGFLAYLDFNNAAAWTSPTWGSSPAAT